MAVAHGTFNKVELHGSLLGLFDLGEDNHDESNHEDGEGNHQSRRSVGNLSLRGIGNQSTHKDVASHGCGAVEHTAELDKLVALVAATAEEVEHGVYHAVEDTHAEACDECADEVNGEHEAEVLLCVELTAVPLDEDADDTDSQADESRFLVAVLGNQHSSGNTHNEIGEEVAVVTDLREYVGNLALVLDDGCHRRAEVRHEGNHGEERNHHDDGSPLFLLITHGFRFCFL